jgi:predicted nucleic acid-binding protein
LSVTLVDTNILLDILTNDPHWCAWSESQLDQCSDKGILAINPIIYAEFCAHFEYVEAADRAVNDLCLDRHPLPWDAAFMASRCYLKYKKSGGTKISPLPDFYIGAHAAFEGMQLLTRDAKRYRNYFPKLKIIAP